MNSTYSKISPTERVYCNRSLKMDSLKAIGFDMDYTLALYHPYSFEHLVYQETLNKMVANGYPEEILSWKFDESSMIRGLVIDKHRGNILKLDRHGYVKIAYHGFKKLSQDEKREVYDRDKVISYKEPQFAFLDTFFALAEAFLVSKLVECKDSKNILKNKTYFDFYVDVRKFIDLSHRDDALKQKVSRNPKKYLTVDPHLPSILHELRTKGKKLFILTNSLWDYVNPIMSHLLPENVLPGYKHWSDYFDFIMTGGQKPQFFCSKNLMYEVDPSNGFLKNLPDLPHGEILSSKDLEVDAKTKAKIFQGGHVELFNKMLGITRGSEVLYVGDHIYGDILRSKKGIGWRTMLILDELENELNGKFHPVWGEVMKTGRNNSFFSAQMSYFACLYSSKFTNFRHYNVAEEFFAMQDMLPHDLTVYVE